MYDDYQRERRRQSYEAAVISERWKLAEQLDRLIAANRCDEASDIALKAGYRDIMDGVHRACEVDSTPDEL